MVNFNVNLYYNAASVPDDRVILGVGDISNISCWILGILRSFHTVPVVMNGTRNKKKTTCSLCASTLGHVRASAATKVFFFFYVMFHAAELQRVFIPASRCIALLHSSYWIHVQECRSPELLRYVRVMRTSVWGKTPSITTTNSADEMSFNALVKINWKERRRHLGGDVTMIFSFSGGQKSHFF